MTKKDRERIHTEERLESSGIDKEDCCVHTTIKRSRERSREVIVEALEIWVLILGSGRFFTQLAAQKILSHPPETDRWCRYL